MDKDRDQKDYELEALLDLDGEVYWRGKYHTIIALTTHTEL